MRLTGSYAYNVRSWLDGINSSLFTEALTYSYSGNIATQQWKQAGKTRNYNFSYDALSRLTAAVYSDNETTTSYGKPNYSTSYAYDKQGNIIRLLRYGNITSSVYMAVDSLTINYRGNQLLKVTDSGIPPSLSSSADFRKISTAAGTVYAYDTNGNLKRDPNKGITNIEYNVLNLPVSISINNTLGQITNTYVYTANGEKLRVSKGSFKTDYVGNMIYENDALKRILVDNGYYENGMYCFYVRDHLGNNRIVANQNGNIVQSTQYYPFGMAFADGLEPSNQPYKYNGKELDGDRGLNLYDYEARHMDSALGRFMTMDPLAEKYYSVSPYAYCKNNPVNRIDPDGKDDYRFSKLGQIYVVKGTKNNGSKTDRLIAANGSYIIVNDKYLLPGLSKNKGGNVYRRRFYEFTSNIEDAVNVFKFSADNTENEWGLDVYTNGEGLTAAVTTDMSPEGVSDSSGYKEAVGKTKVVDLHSHSKDNGTRGGSPGDLENASKKENKKSRNAVYHKKDQKLYEYDSTQSSYNTASATSYKEILDYVKKWGTE